MLIDVFHDVAYPDKLTQGMYKLLSPGGKVLISDIDMCGDIKQDFERGKILHHKMLCLNPGSHYLVSQHNEVKC